MSFAEGVMQLEGLGVMYCWLGDGRMVMFLFLWSPRITTGTDG